MRTFLQLFLFIYLIYISLSIVPFWNFEKSTINLLPNENQNHEYTLTEYIFHFKLKCNYKRNLLKTNGVKIKNQLNCEFTNDPNKRKVVSREVDFEEVESIYTDKNGRYYICPKGRHHVLLDQGEMKPIIHKNFVDEGDWDLKCFLQFEKGVKSEDAWKKLFVFYLNKEDYIYEINANTGDMTIVGSNKYHFIDFKWTGEENNDKFPMYAIIEKNKKIIIEHLDFYVKENPTKINDEGQIKYLLDITNSNFKGYLKEGESNSQFYYVSYETNSTDLFSGYSDNLNLSSNDESSKIINNSESPLKFIGNVSIENIKFIPFSQYSYYKLNDKEKNKNYYGIIDIKANKVIYNTDEQLINYINYLNNSMLSITSKSAYRICTIFYDNNCADTCSNTIYYDTENGNRCEESYQCFRYKLIPDNICITSCDTNIFNDDEQRNCGLCKDFNKSEPYKMVNHTGCLTEKINNSHFVNEKYGLITCDDNYSFVDGKCESNCYETCKTCSEKSNNNTNQKCLSCKNDFPMLYEGNCLKDCPYKTFKEDNNTCIKCSSMCETCDKNGCTSCSSGNYLNTNTHSCEPCHKNCETCSSGGTDENNNCDKCKNKNYKFENGNCTLLCKENEYSSGDDCQPCKTNCKSCLDGNSCDDCRENYYLNNEKDCRLCYDNCFNCTEGGNETNHNCLSCKNNYFLVISGIYENNCVETCPENTVKNDSNKICIYVEPSNKSEENNNNNNNKNSSSSKSKLIVWIFVAISAVMLIVFNIIFFGNICCCNGKEQDDVKKIQTELSDMKLIIN